MAKTELSASEATERGQLTAFSKLKPQSETTIGGINATVKPDLPLWRILATEGTPRT